MVRSASRDASKRAALEIQTLENETLSIEVVFL